MSRRFRSQYLHLVSLVALSGVASTWADVKNPFLNAGSPDDRRKDRRDSPVLPETESGNLPSPIPQRVKVLRGETITLELATVEDPPSRMVRFVIRDHPVAGMLSPLLGNPKDLSVVSVDYTADPAGTVLEDRFTFAAQYALGRVSAPVPVTIEIEEPAAILKIPATVDFGRVILGRESNRTIPVKNIGTAAFDQALELPSPWEWIPARGQSTLRIEPEETAFVSFRFTPADVGIKVQRLKLPTEIEDHPGIRFTGECLIPFELETPAITLDYDPTTRVRKGLVVLRNKSGKGTAIQVEVDPRLRFWGGKRLWMRPQESRELVFQLPANDPLEFRGEVGFEVEGYVRSLVIHAAPAPAHLKVAGGDVSGGTLDFGEVEVGQSHSLTLRIRNVGGKAVTLEPPLLESPLLESPLLESPLLESPLLESPLLESPLLESPFSFVNPVPPEEREIRAGSGLSFTVEFTPQLPNFHRETIVFRTPSQTLEFKLRADAIRPVPEETMDVTASGGMKGTGGPGFHGPARKPDGPWVPGRSGRVSSGVPSPSNSGVFEGYGELMKSDKHRATAAPTLEQLTNRRSLLREIPPTVRGRNGEIPIPPVLGRDGLLAFSPYKTKTDLRLPRIGRCVAHQSSPSSVQLIWPRPGKNHEHFELEVRSTRYNPEKKRYECVWFPLEKVRLLLAEEYMIAEVRGLSQDAFYLFRVFTRGPGGTHSLPSEEFGVRTLESRAGQRMLVPLMVLTLILAAGGGIYFFRQRGEML